MQLEDRFLVLKYTDINIALTENERTLLRNLVLRIYWYRQEQGKSENRYVVINADEPYFPDVLRLMEVQEKENKPCTGKR